MSLVPSITETLLAWGVTPVGVTRFCEAPGVATVGGTKNPDIEAIASLDPDVVLMDEEENRYEDAQALAARGVPVHATRVRAVADVAPALTQLASVLGVDVDPPHAVGDRDHRGPFFSAWVPIWRRPWMTINRETYGSSLLSLAGIENVFGDRSESYPEITVDEAKLRRPDAVLAPSEPYPFSERHRQELEQVAPVRFVDGQDLFWWGARTADAAARFAQLAAEVASKPPLR